MSKSERLDVVMKRAAIEAPNKAAGKLTNSETIKPYKYHIEKFCEWAQTLGIKREHQIEALGYSRECLIQKYTDELIASGKKATTVHNYIAPVCKGLGVSMAEINKPARMSADIVKNTKLAQNRAGARQENDPANARIVRFAEVVTVRPQAMVRLTIDNLVTDENGDCLIKVRDKGGKESVQLILPHEIAFVRNELTHDRYGNPLRAGEKPFTTSDLKEIAFSKYRILRAQAMEQHFDSRFNAWRQMPSKTAAERIARKEARQKAEVEKEEWIEKIIHKYAAAHPKMSSVTIAKYRRELEKPSRIVLREGNRARALGLGRPEDYDRVAVRIASVYTLSHWEDESTIRNYLTK